MRTELIPAHKDNTFVMKLHLGPHKPSLIMGFIMATRVNVRKNHR